MNKNFNFLSEYVKTEKNFAKICRTDEYVWMKAESGKVTFQMYLHMLLVGGESIYIDGDIEYFNISPMGASFIRVQFDNSPNKMLDNSIVLYMNSVDTAKFIKKYSEAGNPIHVKFYIKKIDITNTLSNYILQPEGYMVPDIDTVEFFTDIKFPHLICPECKKDYGNLQDLLSHKDIWECLICSDPDNIVDLELVDTVEKYHKLIEEGN